MESPKLDSIIAELLAQLEAGKSESLTAYLTSLASFHNYSFGNVLMIARQKPGATRVAGFGAWKELGRYVKKGEKGIAILAPLVRKVKPEESKDGEEGAKHLYGFRVVYVFDVTQTDGAPLPEIEYGMHGEVGDNLARLRGFAKSQGIDVSYDAAIAPAFGVSMGGKIRLLPDMTPADEFSTLAHELAHEMLHHGERRNQTNQTIREMEAESVSFVVSRAIGLETGHSCADYIHLYDGNVDLFKESLTFIQKIAAAMLDAIAVKELLMV